MAYTYIWKIKIEDESKVQPFIDNWRAASIILQEYPGALGTRLLRSLDDPLTFYAIPEWESKADRDAMEADRVSGSERGERWSKLQKNDDFGTVEPVARLELIETVSPQ